jgi:hypothetical protein
MVEEQRLDEDMMKKTETEDPAVAQDAVFGEITEEGPNYRNVSCLIAPDTKSWPDSFLT